MLKRLELIGFKSFADKTQFDFTGGVTAIVGPNGSGKSNIVDAVRWIMGEQSAKSLRGGEMADVIFNGSTSRRSLGLAEVTMTFDNSRHILNTDVSEVQITRRVYRGGEGEYLINQQICRLKDIKDLFLGSGAGADAYCIIEQGRVDVLLQSSTKERRTIFEEAAGISRFKAKKMETVRKLERVDQNLQRLQDIIDEVADRLRSVKLQATKAQRFQDFDTRLKELRVALGLADYHQLTEKLDTATNMLEGLRSGLEEHASQTVAWEAETRRLEETLLHLDGAAHEQEMNLANARQRIAAAETTLTHEWQLSTDLDNELAATRGRMSELNARVAALAEAAAQTVAELRGVEAQGFEQRQDARLLEDELQAAVVHLSELKNQVQADHAEHTERMRQASRLQNDVVGYKAQVDNLKNQRERLLHKTEQAAEHLASIDVVLQELTEADDGLQLHLAESKQSLADQRRDREHTRLARDDANQLVSDLKAEHSGLASRIEVLEGLERSHEGLGAGVREVLALREQRDPGPWSTIIGMIADVLAVRHEYAPLIDLALGEKAKHFLVRDAALLAEALGSRSGPLSSRVGFLPLHSGMAASQPFGEVVSLDIGAGVLARAHELATCDIPELTALPRQLLGRTLLVEDLATARRLADTTHGYQLVTLQGELLESDGTLTVGDHHAGTGILSRKSELRELRQQAGRLERRIADCERHLGELRDRVAQQDSRVAAIQEEIDVLAEQAADLRSLIVQHRQRREGLHEEVTLNRSEIGMVEKDMASQEEAWQLAKSQYEQANQRVHALQERLEKSDLEIREGEHLHQRRQQEASVARVALAKVEERLKAVREKHRQIETDLEQRRLECSQGENRVHAAVQRLLESACAMLQASSDLAYAYLEKERSERQVADLARERDLQRQERQLLAERAQFARQEWQARQEDAHTRELEANDLRHRRATLSDRLREDYQLELEELYRQQLLPGAAVGMEPSSENQPALPALAVEPAPPFDPAAVNEEIAELRRKLARLGSVNLDSLRELAELEVRSSTLQTQSEDLVAAKRALEEIIQTINEDSRRLFSETFEAIRSHFQELFRKLFGGGMAEIVLEDENDILESGIEIIARPPGKELRSISLMSGGEKTMTAVALLLAIFRSKPSPFCILDEVDAALDEANIGRYTAVLRDFLDRSQFIIITHSKKTMATADVLYGITMQESGISKRVSVRFEDWPDDPPAATEATATGRNGQEPGFAGR